MSNAKPKPVEDMSYGIDDQSLDSAGGAGSFADFGVDPFAEFGIGDIFEDSDANSDIDGDASGSVDLLCSEEDNWFTYDFNQKFDNASESVISDLRKRRSERALTKSENKVTVDDFETQVEQRAFLIVDHYTQKLFSNNSDSEDRINALLFFFGDASVFGKDAITFELCCDVLRARADVIRLRINYEFWRMGVMFNAELPFEVAQSPEILYVEIQLASDIVGQKLCNEIWIYPSISSAQLCALMKKHYELEEHKVMAMLDLLAKRHLISVSNEGWYLTGRNPMLDKTLNVFHEQIIRGGSIAWSRYFKG